MLAGAIAADDSQTLTQLRADALWPSSAHCHRQLCGRQAEGRHRRDRLWLHWHGNSIVTFLAALPVCAWQQLAPSAAITCQHLRQPARWRTGPVTTVPSLWVRLQHKLKHLLVCASDRLQMCIIALSCGGCCRCALCKQTPSGSS